MKSSEELSFSLSDFVGYPSSNFVSAEKEMVEYLNKTDRITEGRKNYAVAIKEV